MFLGLELQIVLPAGIIGTSVMGFPLVRSQLANWMEVGVYKTMTSASTYLV